MAVLSGYDFACCRECGRDYGHCYGYDDEDDEHDSAAATADERVATL